MHSIVTTFRGADIKVEVANFCAAMDTLIDQDDMHSKSEMNYALSVLILFFCIDIDITSMRASSALGHRASQLSTAETSNDVNITVQPVVIATEAARLQSLSEQHDVNPLSSLKSLQFGTQFRRIMYSSSLSSSAERRR